MDSIIARIAVRPATFASPSVMTTSPSRIEVSIQDDPRLLAALAAIVSHSAHKAGLSHAAQQDFTQAALDACRDTFLLVNDGDARSGVLRLLILDFADRVEVTIEHRGKPLPTAGLDTFCSSPLSETGRSLSGALQRTKVDRILYESRDGFSRVTLVKYSRARPLGSSSSA
jgi:hypothetical protein